MENVAKLDKSKTACFTGHRPDKLGGYAPCEFHLRIKNAILHAILDAMEEGYTHFITGMALGVDTWACEILVDLIQEGHPIGVTAAVPFYGFECRWTKESQKHYRELLTLVDDVVIVTEGGYAPWKMMERNKFMVDHSSRLIAVWDGTEGGTGNTVAYAQKTDITIDRINPESFYGPKKIS